MEPGFVPKLVRRQVRQPRGGLRLPVHDEQLRRGLGRQQLLDEHRRELPASLLDEPQRRQRPLRERAGPQQQLERRGHAGQDGALLPLEQVEGRLREDERVAEDDTAAAPQVRMQERGAVAVEEREDDQDPVVAAQLQERDDGIGVRLDVAVRHPHGLRPGGRPGREHEDGVGARVDRDGVGPVGLPARPEGLVGENREAVTEGCRRTCAEHAGPRRRPHTRRGPHCGGHRPG